MKLAAVQVGLDPGDPDDEVAEHVAAAGRVDDLGVELDAVEVPLGGGQAGVRVRVGLGGAGEALRQPGDGVAVAHPDGLLAVDVLEQAVRAADADVRRPVLAAVGGQDVPAELMGHQLRAVADAEDGEPPVPDRRVRPRGIGVVDRHRAAGEDDRARPSTLDLLVRGVVRQQLGVDVELADPARDQLGELAAEVEDDDRAGRGGPVAVGPVVGGAVGGRGLERRLEVGLDLGVVRGEDPVTGVRRLAVDRLAPLWMCRISPLAVRQCRLPVAPRLGPRRPW